MRYIINQIVEAIEAEIHEAWTESDADFNRGMEYAVSIVRALDIRTDSDTISRQDALAEFKDGRDVYDIMESIESLPSAEPNGDLISRQAVIELIKNSYYNLAENMDDVWAVVHDVEQLLSAEVEDRLYIKIYADDEPSVKAEKLYQICDETQNGEVAEWLKEYFPSAPDSRQRGKWEVCEDIDGEYGVCSACGCGADFSHYGKPYNFCPNCGSLMTKGD